VGPRTIPRSCWRRRTLDTAEQWVKQESAGRLIRPPRLQKDYESLSHAAAWRRHRQARQQPAEVSSGPRVREVETGRRGPPGEARRRGRTPPPSSSARQAGQVEYQSPRSAGGARRRKHPEGDEAARDAGRWSDVTIKVNLLVHQHQQKRLETVEKRLAIWRPPRPRPKRRTTPRSRLPTPRGALVPNWKQMQLSLARSRRTGTPNLQGPRGRDPGSPDQVRAGNEAAADDERARVGISP